MFFGVIITEVLHVSLVKSTSHCSKTKYWYILRLMSNYIKRSQKWSSTDWENCCANICNCFSLTGALWAQIVKSNGQKLRRKNKISFPWNEIVRNFTPSRWTEQYTMHDVTSIIINCLAFIRTMMHETIAKLSDRGQKQKNSLELARNK